MSSDLPNAGRSPTPEPPADLALAALVRLRGAPLIGALEQHLPGSREHGDATGSYAFAAAVEMGLGRVGAELCRETAKLHDAGKVYVPAAILAKVEADLTSEEREQLESHWEAGAKLALGAGIPDDVCGWLLETRERFDGAGPGGFAGSTIPIASRVSRAACACDLAISAPGGAPAAERRRMALEELRAASGRELDPDVVEAIASVLERVA